MQICAQSQGGKEYMSQKQAVVYIILAFSSADTVQPKVGFYQAVAAGVGVYQPW